MSNTFSILRHHRSGGFQIKRNNCLNPKKSYKNPQEFWYLYLSFNGASDFCLMWRHVHSYGCNAKAVIAISFLRVLFWKSDLTLCALGIFHSLFFYGHWWWQQGYAKRYQYLLVTDSLPSHSEVGFSCFVFLLFFVLSWFSCWFSFTASLILSFVMVDTLSAERWSTEGLWKAAVNHPEVLTQICVDTWRWKPMWCVIKLQPLARNLSQYLPLSFCQEIYSSSALTTVPMFIRLTRR